MSGSLVVAALLAASPAPAGEAPPSAGGDANGFAPEQVKAAVQDHVRAQQERGGGVYRMLDEETGERLELELVDVAIVGEDSLWRIHDPSRRVVGSGYFACVDFHPVGAPREKLYDVDMWLSRMEGRLGVTEVHIHKAPRLVDGKWTKVRRYLRERK